MTLTRRNFLRAIAATELVALRPSFGTAPQSTQGSAQVRAWTPQEHPRLYFDRADLSALRSKRKADPIAAAAWARVQEEIEKGMALALPRWRWSDRWEWDTGADNQMTLGQISPELRSAVSALGISWLLDGNQAHARKATDLLMAVCDFDYWTSPRFFGVEFGVPWRSTLETAEFCRAAACGYDWLYDFMNERERHRLRTALLYKGALPLVQDWADPLTRIQLPAGNWWANCVSGAGAASLALYGEHPLAERFLRLSKEAMDLWFGYKGGTVDELPKELRRAPAGTYYPPNFDSEGGYSEGMGYLDVLIHICYFADAYRRRMGQDVLPMQLMRKVADLILYGNFRIDDRTRAVNFGDTPGGWATGPLETTYLARRLQHPGLQWQYYNSQNNFKEPYYYRGEDSPPFSFLWYDPALRAEEPRAAAPLKVYPGMGMAVMRTGWGHEDSLVAFQCGPTAGHAHPDAASFVLYSRDEMPLIDSGCCGYEMPEQQNYYQTTRAHNTILVGGEGQSKRLAGKIVEQASVPGLGFVLGDATAPYEGRLSRFLRGVLSVDPHETYYVVVDWLEKDGDAPFQWLLHYDGEMTQGPEGYVIRKGRAGVLVNMLEPAEHQLAIRQGYKTFMQNPFVIRSTAARQRDLERADYLEITPSRNTPRQHFFTVLHPFPAGGAAPPIKKLAGADWIGIRVDHRQQGKSDLVGLRMGQAEPATGLEDVETDAQFFCVARNETGTPERALMHGGTYLKVRGQTLMSSPQPATRAVEVERK